VLFVFISFLLIGHSVCHAYAKATKQTKTRHAWRWLKRFNANLMCYRGYLKVAIPVNSANKVKHFKHHRLLLTALAAIISTVNGCPCAALQLKQQIAFI